MIPLNSLYFALSHAVYEGFPEYTYEDRDWEHFRKTKEDKRIIKSRKHTEDDITVVMFPQAWGSTTLGFGGIGGQATTTAYTIVLKSQQEAGYCVYFGGRFAYRIKKPNKKFFEDLHSQYMSKVTEANNYEQTN
jgi:hypothetical protein